MKNTNASQDREISLAEQAASEVAMHSNKTMNSPQCGRLVKRLIKIVTEDGKFAYGTPSRCLDVVEHVFAAHRRMCDNLQACAQNHNLGLGGEPVDEIVVAALEKFMRFPPPVDNEFVAPGSEKFKRPKLRPSKSTNRREKSA